MIESEKKQRVIDLHVNLKMSDSEIISVTGFDSIYVGHITSHIFRDAKMTTNDSMIDLRKKYNEKFNLHSRKKPTLIKKQRSTIQYNSIIDELKEYKKAANEKDLELISHSLINIQDLLLGIFEEHGIIDFHKELYNEIHVANMSEFKIIPNISAVIGINRKTK